MMKNESLIFVVVDVAIQDLATSLRVYMDEEASKPQTSRTRNVLSFKVPDGKNLCWCEGVTYAFV